MDENVKNDAKQVMLVQNADDGRLQAVTGVDRDGNIQTADPTDQNVVEKPLNFDPFGHARFAHLFVLYD